MKILYWLNEISHSLNNIRPEIKSSERIENLKEIYKKYYIKNNVEYYLREGKQN